MLRKGTLEQRLVGAHPRVRLRYLRLRYLTLGFPAPGGYL